MNISDIFQRILLKPEWFLSTKSVIRLGVYVQGYIAALNDTNQPYDINEFDRFCKWVPVSLGINKSLNWSDIIYFMSGHDDERSIELTKELWAEFKASGERS
jgi:hypothetical protein